MIWLRLPATLTTVLYRTVAAGWEKEALAPCTKVSWTRYRLQWRGLLRWVLPFSRRPPALDFECDGRCDVIQMDYVSLEELRIQFQQEIQTLSVYVLHPFWLDCNVIFRGSCLMCCLICRLKHENLVDMVGFSSDGQYPCVVYPLMSNGSLLDRLACLVNPTCLQMPASVRSQIWFH